MGIRFACHECGKTFNIKRELAGKRGICPACSVRFRIPTADMPTSSPLQPTSAVDSSVDSASRSDPNAAHRWSAELDAASPQSAGGESLFDDPQATWYVRPPSGGQYGPADSATLQQWIEQGRVSATSLLWRDGWAEWHEAGKMIPRLKPSTSGNNFAAASQVATNWADSVGLDADDSGSSVFSVDESESRDQLASDFEDQTLSGESAVGARRRSRNTKRVLTICGLASLAIILLGTLVYLLNN